MSGGHDVGGNSGGVVSGDTFAWWKDMVASHPNDIIISVHHYMLKNTTVASGDWEGMRKEQNGNWRTHYHGYRRHPARRILSLLGWWKRGLGRV